MRHRFIKNNVFFKFALDLHGFYGGNEFAAKAASHELKYGHASADNGWR